MLIKLNKDIIQIPLDPEINGNDKVDQLAQDAI